MNYLKRLLKLEEQYNLREKKSKKKPYSSVTYTTGDPQLNIDHFNKMLSGKETNTHTDGYLNGTFKHTNTETEKAAAKVGTFAAQSPDGASSISTTASDAGAAVGDGGAVGESLDITEDKRQVRRYFIKPQNIWCANKNDVLKALIDHEDENCSVYTLINQGDVKDENKLTKDDIIYYYDDGILYDKNHVRIMDYKLSIKHEEERDHIIPDQVSDAKFADVYADRMTELTKLEEEKILKEANLNWAEQEYKMQDFHNGKRQFNAAAASEEKLKMNLEICLLKEYFKEAAFIFEAAEKKGLGWKKPTLEEYITCPMTATANTIDWFTDTPIEAIKYFYENRNDLKSVLSSYRLGTHSHKSRIKRAIEAIILLINFNVPDVATQLKDYIMKTLEVIGYNIEDLKTVIKNILSDQTLKEKISSIVKEVSSNLPESIKGNNLKEDIEKHDILNPKLWNEDNTLKAEVAEKVKAIVDEFVKGLSEDNIKFNIKDIILIGSNCSYNYTKDSDLDIHVIADTESLQCPDNLYPVLYGAYRSLFNHKFDIDFYDIPVEFYVETEGTPRVSNGCYSVLNNAWVKEPVAEDIPEVDKETFDKEFNKWEKAYKELLEKSENKLTETLVEAKETDILKARSIIADQIRGEWDADKGYTKAAADLAELKDIDTKEAQDMMLDIASEEHVHVGELETAYDAFDPKLFDELEDGHNEADEKAEPANALDYDIADEPIADGLDIEEDYKKGVNNKTLKDVMISVANSIVPEQILPDTAYDVHHLDYDNTNNEIYNISIMPAKLHRSFHAKARYLAPEEKDNLFKNTPEYYENCIKIGDLILSFIKQQGPKAELAESCLKTMKEALKESKYSHEGKDSVEFEEVINESIESNQIEKIETFINDLYALRKESIATEGEYGIGNLVFKEMRNKGYLDNLKDIKNQLKSQELSLTEIV